MYFSVWAWLLMRHNIDDIKLEFNGIILISYITSTVLFSLSIMLFYRVWSLYLLLFLIISHACFPVLGTAFSGCLMLSMFFFKKMELLSDFHEEDNQLKKGMSHDVTKSYAMSVQENVNVEPLVETIRSHASADLKRGAIETLTQICNPPSIGLLKECLSDPDTEVRFYASSGLSRIEERLNADIIKYKKVIEGKDEAGAMDYFNLAKAYYEFIYLAIQDEASLSYYLNQAILNFEKAYQKKDETKIRMALQRAYTKAGRNEDAKELEEKQIESHDKMYLAEMFFKEGRLKDCKKALSEMDDKKGWETIEDVKNIWIKTSPKTS